MRRQACASLMLIVAFWSTLCHSDNLTKDIKKAVERSTLDQPGTKPFHLVATIAPSFDRDKDSGRSGSVEIWWASPTRWKRELRSPQFHQVEIVDGPNTWQKNEGDYFPQWLEQTALELICPIPTLEDVLLHAKDAEQRRIGPMTNLSWTTPSGTSQVPNILRSSVALQSSTGLLLYAGGLGWGAEFKDYQDFHGRMVARSVSVSSPQVTAKITTLEEWPQIPRAFFEIAGKAGDSPLRTAVMDETSVRKNLLPGEPLSWPPLQDGPLEGNVTTELVIDRDGKVRDTGIVVSENPGIEEAGRKAASSLRFQPFLVEGVPVQVITQFTMPFKTVRPPGTESFDSARNYFEHGRHAAFPAFGNGTPYVLRAEFEAKGKSGSVSKGQYEDTWLSDHQWRREASFEKSRYVRSRSGDKLYQSVDGQDAGLLRVVFRLLEPIPAIDTFVESDWRIKRDNVNGVHTVRVLAGYESPEGKLDPEQARGYWFDESGLLVKTYFDGIETLRSEFQEFAGVRTASHIDVLKDGKLAMRIRVLKVSPPDASSEKNFEIKGHEWSRAFTAEAR